VRQIASGSVNVVETLKIEVFEARFLLSAGASRLGSRRRMVEEDISTEVE
jgi:hypothetical protein